MKGNAYPSEEMASDDGAKLLELCFMRWWSVLKYGARIQSKWNDDNQKKTRPKKIKQKKEKEISTYLYILLLESIM